MDVQQLVGIYFNDKDIVINDYVITEDAASISQITMNR